MTPSPTPATSSAVSTMITPAHGAQERPQQQGGPPSPTKPPMPKRRKKEITLFQKNPSRPFALAQMQAANGKGPATSSSVLGTGPRFSRPQPSSNPTLGVPTTKPQQSQSQQLNSRSPSASSTPPPASSSQNNSSTATTTTPDLPYQEYQLMSCDRHGWQYDVFKFDSRKSVDIQTWPRPVKLNRKEIKRADTSANAGAEGDVAPVPVGPMLGPDGKPVIGADGRIVMVDAEGKPIRSDGKSSVPSSMRTGTPSGSKDEKTNNNKKKKFQKKTRQVFLVPDHIRQLRKEERYPWVMEDTTGKEVWEGRMEEASKSDLHGLFMPAPDQVFKFVPAHRWYKFQKRRPQHLVWSLEEAEKMMAKMQKSKDPERWLRRADDGKRRTAPMAGGLGGGSLVYDEGRESRALGGRRLHTVDTGSRDLFGDDDDDEGGGARRARERARGAEGDLDEMEYEEDFADDDEQIEVDPNDEEAKELEERLKREYKNANKTREGHIDESDEEEDMDNLTGAGKEMKKLVRKVEKNAAYDSEEDENPYASSQEEEEEEEPTPTATGVQEQPQTRPASKANSRPGTPRAGSRSGSPAPPSGGSTAGNVVKIKSEGGGTTSVVSSSSSAPGGLLAPPQSPVLGMGGHSIVAKRATSPKAPSMPKMKTTSTSGGNGNNRATSPLAGSGGSRAGSPNPISPGGGSRSGSPGVGNSTPTSASKKRKAEDGAGSGSGSGATISGASISAPVGGGGGGNIAPKTKKRKPGAGGANASASGPGTPISASTTSGSFKTARSSASIPASSSINSTATTSSSSGSLSGFPVIDASTSLSAALLVQWLKASPGATTRECIQYFQPCLTNEGKKNRFTGLVKEVAALKGGYLILKGQYRDGYVGESVEA